MANPRRMGRIAAIRGMVVENILKERGDRQSIKWSEPIVGLQEIILLCAFQGESVKFVCRILYRWCGGRRTLKTNECFRTGGLQKVPML